MMRFATALRLGAAVLALPALGACGEPQAFEDASQTRVASATLDGVVYTLKAARELDPRDPGERVYLEGRSGPTDRPLVGAFLVICNATDGRVDTARELRLLGSAGVVGSRLSLAGNRVAYEPRELGEGECAPRAQSLPSRLGPGLLVLFEVPEQALGDPSLRLEIEAAEGGERRSIPVRLGRP